MSVGIASTCFPRSASQELFTRMDALGATTTDLAVGRKQRWEVADPDGAILASLGIDILTVGVRIEIGSAAHPPESIARWAAAYPGRTLRVFASDDSATTAKRALVAEQLAAAGSSAILVDVHQGHASESTLLSLTAELGLGLVLDNEGLAFVAADARSFVDAVSPFVRVLHLKGFDRFVGSLSTSNRALGPADLRYLLDVLEPIGPTVPIVLQTRSASVQEDHRLLTRLCELRA